MRPKAQNLRETPIRNNQKWPTDAPLLFSSPCLCASVAAKTMKQQKRRINSRLNPRKAALAVLALLSLQPSSLLYAQQSAPAKLDLRSSPEQRAEALLREMSLEEKIGQLNQLFLLETSPRFEQALRRGEIGSFLFTTDPAEINRLQKIAVEETRLHIPLLFGFDVIHGFRTIFPVPLAMAASWDSSMVEKAQAIAAREARAVGIHWAFAPMVDIARDPRWGRIVEGAGEDPYLGSAMARAQVRGFQGDTIGSPDHVLACVKHFAGYGAAEGGRDYDASYISDAELWNVYLPPFKAAVDAGVGSVMSAYMDLNDVPATGNRWLMQDVLRENWKFRGFVVSDMNAVKSLTNHGFARDPADAAARALTAGVNMEMSIGTTYYSRHLAEAVKQGRVSTQQIDAAVRPLLETKFRLGLFENPYVDLARVRSVLENPEHREAARIAAERSAVLLRNQGGLLPLSKTTHNRVAVIGPLADSKLDTLGPWTLAPELGETVTPLEGIRKKLGPGVSVEYAPGAQLRRKFPSPFDALLKTKPAGPWTEAQAKDEINRAVELARAADVAVLVMGELQEMSGESASRSTLDLPGKQQELLEAVVATGKPVVLLLISGRPLNITWASEHVPAILEGWYPGTAGGSAIANLLFGDAAPGGKLPVTWPRNVGQVPIYYSHNLTQAPQNQDKRYWNEESTPLYPFGFGLGYTTFSFSNLRVSQPEVALGQTVDVSVEVENTGSRAGDEVAQLYIHQQAGSASRPVRQLKGFQRITLAPAEKKTVRFSLRPEDLQYWSAAEKRWVTEPATFDLWVGADSTAPLHSTFKER
jgi:beta-glucosidase